MKKATVRKRVTTEYQAFLQSFGGLPDNILLSPKVVGVWTIRDVLAHISTWEEEALKNIPLILNNQRTPRYASTGGIDAFNAQEQDWKKDLTLPEIKQEAKITHQRLITFLANIPEDDYATNRRLSHRIRLDTYNHYHEHAEQILGWRTNHGL